MGETIITWNVTNWITVCLMALIGFLILGTVGTFAKKAASGS
jgi:hypothetical protein